MSNEFNAGSALLAAKNAIVNFGDSALETMHLSSATKSAKDFAASLPGASIVSEIASQTFVPVTSAFVSGIVLGNAVKDHRNVVAKLILGAATGVLAFASTDTDEEALYSTIAFLGTFAITAATSAATTGSLSGVVKSAKKQ